VGVTRRPLGARRGSPDPADLPDRQVSRAHRRPRFRRCSCFSRSVSEDSPLAIPSLTLRVGMAVGDAYENRSGVVSDKPGSGV
jgi:hypothetical protein